jgi:heat shock protein HslJ
MIKRILSIICIFLAASLLAACASAPGLKSTRWQLTQLNGQPALEGVTVTLNLEEDTLGGSDGCNTYGGSYTSKGSAFKTGGDIFSTMMYCSDTINNQATAYFTALDQATSFTLQDNTLSLLDASRNVILQFSILQN